MRHKRVFKTSAQRQFNSEAEVFGIYDKLNAARNEMNKIRGLNATSEAPETNAPTLENAAPNPPQETPTVMREKA
ncbi:hypothetical protein HY407_03680 [Candidatus Gottesmanbacteria bacterium]|nr:hypothetical protein [Candidatus Gottesmanbacteria bacterium]